MTAENKTRLLLNDGLTEQLSAGVIGGFVEMATERAILEIPYRAASLYALSVGDVDWSRTIMAALSGDLIAAETERCAKIADGAKLAGGIQESDMAQFKGYHAAAEHIAAEIRKDRGCEPPQAETK